MRAGRPDAERGGDLHRRRAGRGGRSAPEDEIRVLVGPWNTINADPVARLLAGGPQRSGVFANFAGVEPSVGLTLLDARGRVAETLGRGAGLVAALRPDDGPPTWVVTGTDAAGVAAAIELLRRGGPARPLRGRHRLEQGPVGGAGPVRAALAYTPGRSPLHRAPAGSTLAFLGSLAFVAFAYSNPLVLLADGVAVVARRARGGRPAGVSVAGCAWRSRCCW